VANKLDLFRNGTRIDSEEIRKAYKKQRFYYVFSSPPLPPGAPLPDLLEEYQRKLVEYQKQFISLTISIDEQGRITPYHKAEDYNLGLMKITTDEDAKIAAAAILSLYGSDRVGPGSVAAKEVTLTRGEKGWSCSVLPAERLPGHGRFRCRRQMHPCNEGVHRVTAAVREHAMIEVVTLTNGSLLENAMEGRGSRSTVNCSKG
jgi:hypothetical protein